ncbi:MAG: citrate synthase [Acidimicrobiales bacterium]|nr:citrate synthase [Acidimicrobiales bacterium]
MTTTPPAEALYPPSGYPPSGYPPSGSLPSGPLPPGLRGVPVTETEIGDVCGLEGFYHYRQHSATELAAKRSLEDVWRLLFDGSLPATPDVTLTFATETRRHRILPAALGALLPAVAALGWQGGPLDGLRSALSLYGSARQLRPLWDLDEEERREDLMALATSTPVLAAALHRLSSGLEAVAPDPELGHAANYLRMLTGCRPDPELARALEQYLILTVDHGFNSSTFTARVIASTGADAAAAIVGALGALSGPLHGGAPSRALALLDAIGRPERAEPVIRAMLERGERIMGFGHAVYRTEDPRSVMLRAVAQSIGGDLADLAVEVEQTVDRLLAELRPGRPLYANVEFYAGVVMSSCGIPPEMFTPTFAVSRVIGWCANVAEQARERTLIRPAARYVGPPPPAPVPPGPGA